MELKIRAYESKDYHEVFRLVQECSVEAWTTAYWNTFNGSRSMPLILRIGVLIIAIQVLLHSFIINSIEMEM